MVSDDRTTSNLYLYGSISSPDTSTYVRGVEDVLDVQDIGDVPRVLGEGAEGEGIAADKGCGGVGQALLLVAGRNALLKAIEERLWGVEDQWLRIACKKKMVTLSSRRR
jgi:hypothetical protein